MNVRISPGQIYLSHALAPFKSFLERPDVTDIYVNKPGALWIETIEGKVELHPAPDLHPARLDILATQIASYNHQGVSREHPLLSAILPDGERVQFVVPPATRDGLVLAIRKQCSAGMTLEDYASSGSFNELTRRAEGATADIDAMLKSLHASGSFTDLLSLAVKERRNILVSGGTSTGKTTFLNALIREIDEGERLIFIEDTPELDFRHPNAVGLVAARSALGEAVVSMEDLLNASLRMRPDRIILGELRGPEAFTFLRAVNTGHPGSMTTVHADSPDTAIEQIALLVMNSGTQLSRESVAHYVRSTIDVYVQLERRAGRRYVADIKLRRSGQQGSNS